jgi:hypothetical protein
MMATGLHPLALARTTRYLLSRHSARVVESDRGRRCSHPSIQVAAAVTVIES